MMRRMDIAGPSLRVQPGHRPPVGPYGSQWMRSAQTPTQTQVRTTGARTIDTRAYGGLIDIARQPRRRAVADGSHVRRLDDQRLPVAKKKVSASIPMRIIRKLRRRLSLKYIYWSLGVLLMVIMAITLQSLVYGELEITLFAIFACIRRIESRIICMLALTALLTVVLATILGRSTMAANFAVYALLFLMVGMLRLALELRAVARRE